MTNQPFQRNTRQRDVILGELRNSLTHPTATELYDLVRRRLPKISLGTVYRNLDLLARMGIIQRLEMAGAETRFDGDRRPHDHIRCAWLRADRRRDGATRGSVAGERQRVRRLSGPRTSLGVCRHLPQMPEVTS